MKTWQSKAWFGLAVVVVICLGGLPPPVQAGVTLQQTAAEVAGSWVTIMTEGFEGAWPSTGWRAYDGNGATDGELYWDEDDYKPHTGTQSAWCANGGANGRDPQVYDYPNYMDSWAVYGPFSLADASEAELEFWVWNASEPSYDYFRWLASADCTNYYGYRMSIPTDGWDMWTMDLSSVPTIGDLTGDDSVCVAFRFTSDYYTTNDGAFVDDVVLRKYVGSTCYSLTTAVSPAGSGTVTPSAPNCPDNPSLYAAGTAVTLTAAPSAGYAFDEWSGAASGSVNPTTVTMDGDKSVTANFVPAAPCYALTLSVDEGGGALSATPPNSAGCPAGYYSAGEEITLNPDPDDGCVFHHYESEAPPIHYAFVSPDFSMPAGNRTVWARYFCPDADYGVYAGAISIAAGDTGVIPLYLWNFSDKLVGAITVDLYYDPEVVQPTGCDADPNGSFDQALCNAEYFTDTVRLTAASTAGVPGNALLANITFLGVGPAESHTDLPNGIHDLAEPSGEWMPDAGGRPGWIDILPGPGADGDVDCDGDTDATDALFVLQREVGLRPNDSDTCPPPADGLFLPACDVTGYGECDVVDAMFILQCEVGIPNALCPDTTTRARDQEQDPGLLAPQPTATLDVGVVEQSADGTVTAPVWLALDDRLLGAATVRLKFNPAVYQIEACTADPGGRMDGALCNVDAARGVVRLTALSVQGVSGDLVLAEITFRSVPGARKGVAPVLKDSVLVDPAGRPIGGVIHYGSVK